MRRRLVSVLAGLALLVAAGASPGAAEVPIRVFVHGEQVHFPDQEPIVVSDRTLVPVRAVFESIGAEVTWDSDARRVTVSWTGNQAAVFIGSTTAWVNGSRRTLDVAPRIVGDRTMVPLRFLAEALGLKVEWYDPYWAVVVGQRPSLPVLAPSAEPNLVMPCTIRVAMRPVPPGTDEPPREGSYEVKEVELSEYVVRVLAHEFGDFTDEGGTERYFLNEALKAGALAIQMYAWYYAWHPAAADYDLDNSVNYQVYIPNKPLYHKHIMDVNAIWGKYMVRSNSGEVFAPEHGRGWYNARSEGTDWMSQRGSLYLDKERGYAWDQILRYYYRNIDIRQYPHPCGGLQ